MGRIAEEAHELFLEVIANDRSFNASKLYKSRRWVCGTL
jgi:hypothetical protein